MKKIFRVVALCVVIGCTGSVTFLLIGFSLGICSGFAIPVAQRFGAQDYDNMRKYLGIITGSVVIKITKLIIIGKFN